MSYKILSCVKNKFFMFFYLQNKSTKYGKFILVFRPYFGMQIQVRHTNPRRTF